MAGARDPGGGRRGHALPRRPAGRHQRRGGRNHVPDRARHRLRRHRAGRARAGRARRAHRRRAGAAAAAPGGDRTDRLVRRPGRAAAERALAAAASPPAPSPEAARGSASPVRRRHLGHAHGHQGRPDLQRLAHPALHRPGSPVQVRPGQGLPARGRRAPVRHVPGRVHPRGRSLHLRDAARAVRARRIPRSGPSARSSTTWTARTTSSAGPRRRASPR